ncbi:signal peptidase I [Anoxybacillus vitaminiphilus]|uniref:Signal peptidase I n=1 Tax=Paranoxybacillus vitaminiphilus TaxID=581036 RepID=A0A327YJV6_9BACL|nr:signal peptidase I [Anoxybacillus vitaminiphilus]RAK21288.1 signal peptidase I [Anoxybacillus vitaminiphilus]
MSKLQEEILSWGKAIVIAIFIALVIRNLFFAPYVVKGESMLPNLQNDNRLIVSKLNKFAGYHRFDIVVFEAPDSSEKYIKRIIGLPGDTVEMKNDTLYINGKAYDEPYLKELKDKKMAGSLLTWDFTLNEVAGKKVIPEGYVFVLGDNRPKSKDSRHFGLLPMKDIVGKAVFRIWPLEQAGLVQ